MKIKKLKIKLNGERKNKPDNGEDQRATVLLLLFGNE